MTDLKIHSGKAWEIASHWSDVLASDTRTLAAAIDFALTEKRNAALEEAANEIKKLAAALSRIAEHPEASQKKAQAAIDILEAAETMVRALKEKP